LRALRFTLVAAAALIGLLLASAWLIPPALDWNRFRDEISAIASSTLRRDVHIDGPITLVLLPQPVLTAQKVRVDGGNPNESGSVVISAAQLRLRIALGALLAGRIDARELVLGGVDMKVPWPPPPDALMLRAPSWLAALSARIEGGQAAIGNVLFTGIQATLSTADATGTYMAAGTAQLSGHSWRFTARLSQPGGDGSAGLDATLDGQGPVQGVGAALSGQIGVGGGFNGRIDVRGPDFSLLLPAPAVPFHADGRITIAGGLAAADELTIDLGGSPARGAVSLRVAPTARLDVALAASRLDLDAWYAALMRGAGRFPGMHVGIDLSAEAAQLAGGTLRTLRGALELSDGAVELRDVRAMLPGEAPLQLAGTLHTGDAQATPPRSPRFDGYAAVSSPALRTTLAWLQAAGVGVLGRLPPGVLTHGVLAGHVALDSGQIIADGLNGALDDSAVGGALTLRLGARPAVTAVLKLERVELDPWLAEPPANLAALPTMLRDLDLNLQLEAKQARWQGRAVAPLVLDVAAMPGRLTLRKLDAGMDGAHAVASGIVTEGGQIGEGHLDLQATDAAMLLPLDLGLLPERWARALRSMPALWHAPAMAQIQAAGPPAALALHVSAGLGDLRIEAEPTINLDAQSWRGSLTLRHPGAPRFLEVLGLRGAATWLGDGSLSLVAQVAVGSDRIAADSFDLTAGALHATGALALQNSEAGSAVTGHVAAEALPLPPLPVSATEPLTLPVLAGWQASVKLESAAILLGQTPVATNAAATLAIADNVLRLDDFSATAAGGTLTGAGKLDVSASPPAIMLQASLAGAVVAAPLFATPFDLTAGVVDASAVLTAAGFSRAGLLATLAGTATLSAHDGVMTGIDLAKAGGELREEDIRAALAGGSTAFERLDATARVEHGAVTLTQAELTGNAGTIAITGRIDLPAEALDLRLALHPQVPDPPEIGLRVTGPAGAPKRAPETSDVIRWRAEHVTQR
jgi:hypothetical protein